MTLCKKHTIALFVIAVVLLSSCRQEMELAGHNYYYTIKDVTGMGNNGASSYFLLNDQLDFLSSDYSRTIVNDTLDCEQVAKIQTTYTNDCYITENNTYFTGGRSTILTYIGMGRSEQTAGIPFVEINGIRKFFNIPGIAEGILILDEGEDIYFLIQSTINDPEFTTLMYYVSVNGEEPTLIAETHQEIYSLRNAKIKKCKKFGDKFYFVGTKDNVAFFCEASQIKTPFYLSDYGGIAYDLAIKDSVIYECGQNQDKAILWKGQEPYELPLPDGTKESLAASLCVVDNDIYVGGRIDEYPAIWKNGELLAIYTEFPPYWTEYWISGVDDQIPNYKPITMEYGWVCAMEIEGDNIYSLVETSNYVGDRKRFALEWTIKDDEVCFKDEYNLIEMLKTGAVKMGDNFYGQSSVGHITWKKTDLGTPHISPYYIKTKAKRKK